MENFDESMATNVRGPFLWARLLVPAMRAEGRGTIVFTSSVLGLQTRPTRGVYCATKFALQVRLLCCDGEGEALALRKGNW